MNILLIVGLVWLGFCICLVAFFKARIRKGATDPFLAATSGTDAHSSNTHSPQNGDLEDTLRQMDRDRIARQRDALRQSIASRAPKTMAGLVVVLVALLAAYGLGFFTGGREHRSASNAVFGTGKSGFAWGNKRFYAQAGQSIEVNYGIQSGAGRLYLSLSPALNWFQPTASGNPPLWSQTAQTVGTWRAAIPVPQNGYYCLDIAPAPARGDSMVYDVRWKVH